MVSVSLHNGREYGPFGGTLDRRVETVSLTVREGLGDLRCRNWTPGTVCGFPVQGGGLRGAHYLSYSRQGDFVIVFGFPQYGVPMPGQSRADTFGMSVIPAIEGAITPDPS